MKRRRIWIGAGVVALIAVVCLIYAWTAGRSKLEYTGTVETREIEVGSKVGGRVTEVPVEEGQTVKTGAVLVRFECDELKAQRAQAAASVDQARADLDRMLRGNRPEEIEQAEAAASTQKAALEKPGTDRVKRRLSRRRPTTLPRWRMRTWRGSGS